MKDRQRSILKQALSGTVSADELRANLAEENPQPAFHIVTDPAAAKVTRTAIYWHEVKTYE